MRKIVLGISLFIPSRVDFYSGKVQVLRYEPAEPRSIRGDANGDMKINIGDAIAIILKTFFDEGPGDCLRAMDVDGDNSIALNDSIWLMNYLYFGSIAPSPPFPDCGRFGGLRRSAFDCRSSPCKEGR